MIEKERGEELPEDPDSLYSIATLESTVPRRREAAIKKLATVEGSNEQLTALAEGDALTPIELTLAVSNLE